MGIKSPTYRWPYCWCFRNPGEKTTVWMYKIPANNEIFTISTGAGFLPSTVLMTHWNHLPVSFIFNMFHPQLHCSSLYPLDFTKGVVFWGFAPEPGIFWFDAHLLYRTNSPCIVGYSVGCLNSGLIIVGFLARSTDPWDDCHVYLPTILPYKSTHSCRCSYRILPWMGSVYPIKIQDVFFNTSFFLKKQVDVQNARFFWSPWKVILNPVWLRKKCVWPWGRQQPAVSSNYHTWII